MKYKITREQFLQLSLQHSKNEYLKDFAASHFILEKKESNFGLFKEDVIERDTSIENMPHLGGTLSLNSSYEAVRDTLATLFKSQEDAEDVIASYSQIPSYFIYRVLTSVIENSPDQAERQVIIRGIEKTVNIFKHPEKNHIYIQCDVPNIPLFDVSKNKSLCTIPGPVRVTFQLKRKKEELIFEVLPENEEQNASEEREWIKELEYELVSVETDNINILRMMKGKMFSTDQLVMQTLTQTMLLNEIPDAVDAMMPAKKEKAEFYNQFIYFLIEESFSVYHWQKTLTLKLHPETNTADVMNNLAKTFVLTIQHLIETHPWKVSQVRNKGGVSIEGFEKPFPTHVARIYDACKKIMAENPIDWMACFNQITYVGRNASINKPLNFFNIDINKRFDDTQAFYDCFKAAYEEKEEVEEIIQLNVAKH